MSSPEATFSGLLRVDECPTSAAMPVQVRTSSGAANRGDAIHSFLETVLAKHSAIDIALAAVPEEWRETCARIDWDAILSDVDRDTVRSEVAYAIDVTTGAVRELGESIARDYSSVRPTEVPGTLDIEARDKSGRPVVKDFKTGRPVTKCGDNPQMQAGAYALHAKTGAPEIVAQLVYIDEEGGITVDEHVFDAFDLADFPARLRKILAGIERARAEIARGELRVSAGEWCRHCPAFASCPAQVALVRSVAAIVPELDAALVAATPDIEGAIAQLTPEQAGVAWAKWKELAPMFERVESALKAYAKAELPDPLPPDGMFTPIVLPDGRGVYARTKSKSTINAGRALALLKEYGAKEEDIESCLGEARWVELRAKKFPKAKEQPKQVPHARADELKEAGE